MEYCVLNLVYLDKIRQLDLPYQYCTVTVDILMFVDTLKELLNSPPMKNKNLNTHLLLRKIKYAIFTLLASRMKLPN